MSSVVDMCRREKELTKEFVLNIDKWDTVDEFVKQIVSTGWKNIKFLNEEGIGLNDAVNTIPNDKGGIYVFVLQPEILPLIHRYILYIGRAKRNKSFSLRKRCQSYLTDDRIEIAYMRELWGKSLYFYYLPIDDDEIIERVEEELLRVIIPPCNKQIPARYVTVSSGKTAF